MPEERDIAFEIRERIHRWHTLGFEIEAIVVDHESHRSVRKENLVDVTMANHPGDVDRYMGIPFFATDSPRTLVLVCPKQR